MIILLRVVSRSAFSPIETETKTLPIFVPFDQGCCCLLKEDPFLSSVFLLQAARRTTEQSHTKLWHGWTSWGSKSCQMRDQELELCTRHFLYLPLRLLKRETGHPSWEGCAPKEAATTQKHNALYTKDGAGAGRGNDSPIPQSHTFVFMMTLSIWL